MDPVISKGGSFRVFRGGNWFLGAAHCRSAWRITLDPTFRSFGFGFRLALTPSVKQPVAEHNK